MSRQGLNGRDDEMYGVIRSMSAWTILVTCMVGCEHIGVRVDAPKLPTPPTAENDLVRAEYVSMLGPESGKGIIAIRMTNKTDKPIMLGGSQGADIPTKDKNKAWLAYRGSEDLKRFAKTDMSLEFQGADALLSVKAPPEGVTELGPNQSRLVLVAYQMADGSKDLSIDLSPVVSSSSVHGPSGQLRTLDMTIAILDRPTIAQQAKDLINQTKVGLQLGGNDTTKK